MMKSIVLFCCCCLLTPNVWAEEKPSGYDPGVPELAVLARFVGKWEGKLPNSDDRINANRTWVLNGRFLKHEFSLSSGNLSGIIYRGYDQEHSRYTMTFLDSNGGVSWLTGYWSADQKTLTFEAIDSSCQVQKYESYFPDDKTEQWKIVIGETRAEINGIAKKLAEQ